MFTIWYAIAERGISARHLDVVGLAEAQFIWDAMKASGARMVSTRP